MMHTVHTNPALDSRVQQGEPVAWLYCQVLGHRLSMYYSTVTYWATGSPCTTLLSRNWPPALHVLLYCHVLGHWLSMYYSTVTYWATGSPCTTLLSGTGSLALPFVLFRHLLTQWSSLLNSTVIYSACCTLLSGTRPMALPDEFYQELGHWLSPLYSTVSYGATGPSS